jgi:hypothetical protein
MDSAPKPFKIAVHLTILYRVLPRIRSGRTSSDARGAAGPVGGNIELSVGHHTSEDACERVPKASATLFTLLLLAFLQVCVDRCENPPSRHDARPKFLEHGVSQRLPALDGRIPYLFLRSSAKPEPGIIVIDERTIKLPVPSPVLQ